MARNFRIEKTQLLDSLYHGGLIRFFCFMPADTDVMLIIRCADLPETLTLTFVHRNDSAPRYTSRMEDWVYRALEKWPNVPAVFGWMGLDRSGRWTIRGELISRPQIIDTINRNYAADEQGRWFFQNGPQRGYVALEYTPLILRIDGDGKLKTHTDLFVEHAKTAYLDEHGALTLATEYGPGALDDQDLGWALERLFVVDENVDEEQLASALALASGTLTALQMRIETTNLSVTRMDADDLPLRLGFVREPAA